MQVASSSCTLGCSSAVVITPTRLQRSLKRFRPACRVHSSKNKQEQGTEQATSSDPVDYVGMPYKWITATAAAGALETGYLSYMKLAGLSPACPISGCEAVLSSTYSEIHGVPLALLGMATYGAVAGCSVLASRSAAEGQEPKDLHTALLAGSTLLAGVSAILLYILNTTFSGELCVWCYGSAALSFSLLVLVTLGLPPRHIAQAAVPGLGALAVGVATLYLSFGSMQTSLAEGQDFELPYSAPAVTTESSTEAVVLARKLHDMGAKVYGAFWCSHCFDQKQAFGKQAMADFPYVECFPEGWKRGKKVIEACDAAGIKAFPTWVINGKMSQGELTLDVLEAAVPPP